MVGWKMNDELERIWKGAVLVKSRYYPHTSLERLRKSRKTSVRIACAQVEIGTKHLPNACLECFRDSTTYTDTRLKLLGWATDAAWMGKQSTCI
jgi:hypothetical protein